MGVVLTLYNKDAYLRLNLKLWCKVRKILEIIDLERMQKFPKN